MITSRAVVLAILAVGATALGQTSSGPAKGILVVDGGGTSKPVVDEFVKLAGGHEAKIVVIPTGASSLRFGAEKTILNLDWPRSRPEWLIYEKHLKEMFGVDAITVLHTRDRTVANTPEFAEVIRRATGVFLGTGNAGRHAAAYLGARTQRELRALLERGGVIIGSSAGAIVLGSFIVRGRPDKPLLMAKGNTEGFGFLKNVAINPHLTSAKRDNELVNVCDEHPLVLGLGLDDEVALIVRGNRFEVIGQGGVAVYDNLPKEGAWYYWLRPGDSFDLGAWKKLQ
jgi:cyanophycinase